MPPTLHIMRHGQGYHSIAENGHSLRDPHLTGDGEAQCRKRRAAFQRHDQVELLLASPLRRALQTCAITFLPCLNRGLQIIALPMAEECSDAPSDTGSDSEFLKAEFAENHGKSCVSFDHVSEGWYLHEGEYATDPAALIRRAAKLRRWIKARPEKEVVLVAHGFFNHYITGEVDENGEQTTAWWNEAELRTFTFVDGDGTGSDARPYVGGDALVDGEDAALVMETQESLKRMGNRRASVTKNVNRPAERRRSLAGFQTDNVVAVDGEENTPPM